MMNVTLFDALGFHWDRAAIPTNIPVHSIERVTFRFHRMLAEIVWDAIVIEGKHFTYPEVQTMVGGVVVGGKKLTDVVAIFDFIASARRMLDLVKCGQPVAELLPALEECAPFERALAAFLACDDHRTALLTMNAILMSAGMDAISVPAAKAQAYREKIARFHQTKDATEMIVFLIECHPDAHTL